MIRLKIIVLICCAMLALIAFAPTYGQQAVPPTPAYTGMDILFIVDQSGSMGGQRYGGDAQTHGDGSDTLDLRFLGPQSALELLSRNQAIFSSMAGQGHVPEVNLAILAFGSTTEQYLGWLPLDVSNPNWNAIYQRTYEDIGPDRFNDRNLDLTDFRTAFTEARNLFDRAPLPQPGSQHLRVIVLLTDGAPCVEMNGLADCDRQQTDGRAAQHVRDVADFVHDYFPTDYGVYVINLDDRDRYYDQFKREWESVVCAPVGIACDPTRTLKVTSPQELAQQLNRVVTENYQQIQTGIEQRVVQANTPFEVAPYTEVMRVLVFKSSATSLRDVIQLIDPQTGQPALVTVNGDTTAIETHEVFSPPPGLWEVRVPNADLVTELRLSATLIQVGAMSAMPTSDAQMYVPLPLSVTITNANQSALPLYRDSIGQPIYPLQVEAVIYDATAQNPSERRVLRQVPLALETNNPSDVNIYRYDWYPDVSGKVEVRVNASYLDESGQVHAVLTDYSVLDGLTIRESFVDWLGFASASERQGVPVPIQAVLRDKETGNELTGATGDWRFNVQAFADGASSPAYEGLLTNTSAPGQIAAQLVLDTPGSYQVHTELGRVDAVGNFTPVEPAAHVNSLQIRPIIPLSLFMPQPAEAVIPAQGPFPAFWATTPTTVRIEIRDAGGNLVNLRDVTGGQETMPMLTVSDGAQVFNLNDQLREVLPGVYEVETTSLGMGDFTFTGQVNTPASALVGDYDWAAMTVSTTQSRRLAEFIPLMGGGALALVVLVAVVGTAAIRRSHALQAGPLRGALVLLEFPVGQDPRQLGRFQLDHYNRNTVTLTRSDLRGAAPFERITVSTGGDEEMSRQRSLIVKEVVIGGEKKESDYSLGPGQLHTYTVKDQAGFEIPLAVAKDYDWQFGGGDLFATQDEPVVVSW